MTIICAMHEPGVGTWIGSDTMAIRDGICRIDRGPKWTIRNSRALAGCGMNVLNNIIEAHADDLLSGVDPFKLSKEIRRLLIEEYGWTPKQQDGEARWLRSFVIYATSEGVWHFGPDGGCYAIGAGELCADGSGERFAYGASHACQYCGPKAQISAGVAASIALDDGCGGDPFVYLLPAAA